MALVEQSEYKGNAMLVLKRDVNDQYPFSFGVKKAMLILECLGDIRAFVDQHRKS